MKSIGYILAACYSVAGIALTHTLCTVRQYEWFLVLFPVPLVAAAVVAIIKIQKQPVKLIGASKR